MVKSNVRLIGFAFGALVLGGIVVSLNASDRVQKDSRESSVKKENVEVSRQLQRPLSDRPLSVGHMITEGDVTGLWVTLGDEATGTIKYCLGTAFDKNEKLDAQVTTKIRPENFVRMHGTRRGMGALATTLGQLLLDESPNISRIKVPVEGAASIEGVAFFEEDDRVQLLTVRFEEDGAVLEEIGFVATGCVATVPHHTCGCTASGYDCHAGTNAAGTHFAKCKDSAGSTYCTGVGGNCSCQNGAAD